MRNRFKAKPNVSAARERVGSSSIDGRSRVGSDASSQSETTPQTVLSPSHLKEQAGGDGSTGRYVNQPAVTNVVTRMQLPLSRHEVAAGATGQSGHVERTQGGHFVDQGVAPLEPLVEYSGDALGNDVMAESEDIVTGSALALSEGGSGGGGGGGGGASFSSPVSIGNLIAESYALCRDGVVNGSHVIAQDGVGKDRLVVASSEEEEEAVSQTERTSECAEGEVGRAHLPLPTNERDEPHLVTDKGQPLQLPDSVPMEDAGTSKTKNRSHRKRPCPITVPKGKNRGKEEEEEEGDGESVASLSPAKKRSRRKPSKDKPVKDAPDLGKMTMAELISYNPSANPMQSTLNAKEKQRNGTRKNEPLSDSVDGAGRVEGVSDTRPLPHATVATPSTGTAERNGQGDENVGEDGRLVPQLMVDEDGKIVVNESSMIVHSSRVDPELAADKLETVYEIAGDFSPTTSGSKKRGKMKLWTEDETKLFYRALSQVGTDFTMMTVLMGGRSRGDLKKKFKKEEKTNPHKVNSALKKRLPITTTASPK